MEEFVLLTSPILLVIYGLMLAIGILGTVFKRLGFIFTIISVLGTIGASVYALLIGVSLQELAIIFLLEIIIVSVNYLKKGEKA